MTFHHFAVTGQSLAVGQAGTGKVSTDEYPANTGRPSGTGFTSILTGPTSELPDMALGIDTYETFRDDLANSGAFVSVATNGASGTTYSGLKKGTATYTAMMGNVTSFDTDSAGAGTVDGFHIIHGESDAWNGTTRDAYLAALLEWQTDFNTDAKAITGQVANIPAIFSQPWDAGMPTTSSEAMVLAHKQSDVHFLVGPKFFMPRADGVHLTSAGYKLLGQYHAKAQREILMTGSFTPLLPSSIVRTGAVVVATFPTDTQLVWDTTTVPAQTNYGFAYTDTNGTATIDSVVITGVNQVTTTLSAEPTGFGSRLRYAANGNGQQGNLRNSDTLPDWCCHFVETVSQPGSGGGGGEGGSTIVRIAGTSRTVAGFRIGGESRAIAQGV